MPIDVRTWPDLDPVSDLLLTGLEAGADSDVLRLALVNATADDFTDLLVLLEVESLTVAGLWLGAGLPPVDERWGRARLNGQDNSGAPAQVDRVTAWQSWGAYSPLLVPEILAGGTRVLEVKLRPPAEATAIAWRFRVRVLGLEHARPLPLPLTRSARGILTGIGDPDWTSLLGGGEVTASEVPDDQVLVDACRTIRAGALVHWLAADVTLNQNDGAAAALAPGQSYQAVITAGAAGPTTTKGAKGAAPVRPTAPAGEPELALVTVAYGAGGSEIGTADVVDLRAFDRHVAMAGPGLLLKVHAGQVVAAGTWRVWSTVEALTLADDSTLYLWQHANGGWEVTDSPMASDGAAFGPLYQMTTAGGEVTDLVDLRTWAQPLVVLTLEGQLAGGLGLVAETRVWEEMAIEQVVAEVSDNGGASSGDTVLGIDVAGVTIYTSQATDDQRPRFAHDATELLFDAGVHEVVALHRGDVVTEPTGGTPASARVHLLCRRL
jgi:hypothetical protein